jgi:hypothetical protein
LVVVAALAAGCEHRLESPPAIDRCGSIWRYSGTVGRTGCPTTNSAYGTLHISFYRLELKMLRLVRRSAIAALTATALVAGLTLVATPASAHSLDTAVRASAGCGWSSGSYSIRDQRAVTNAAAGVRLGTVYLLWHGGRGENCVVTRKTGSSHGTASQTSAILTRQGLSGVADIGQFSHYAAAAGFARNVCVKFLGTIKHPTTGVLAAGGRSTWGNCGG